MFVTVYTVPRRGRLVGEELVAHGEAEVVVELLVAVEVVEPNGGRHGARLADEHWSGSPLSCAVRFSTDNFNA